MSMKTWTESGFGYELFNGDNFEAVKEFCIKELEKEGKNEMVAEVKNTKKESELSDVLGWFTSNFIAEAIARKEGINNITGYSPCGETDAPERLGIIPAYPWQLTEKAKNLSKEDCKNILKKYANELGITEEPDYFEQEYYG